jgi:hypothetical protein
MEFKIHLVLYLIFSFVNANLIYRSLTKSLLSVCLNNFILDDSFSTLMADCSLMGIIETKNEKLVVLDSAKTFGCISIILNGGIDTNYICSYADKHYSILNITESKSFTIEKGILLYGDTSLLTPTDYYFVIVNGTRIALLSISNVEIKFVSQMNSLIYVLGGGVILKDVKMESQTDSMWVYPLVDIYQKTTNVIVELYLCTIINCSYKCSEFSVIQKSGIVYFGNNTIESHNKLNLSLCSFYNNVFNLSNGNSVGSGGAFSLSTSGMFCLLILYLFYLLICLFVYFVID